MVKKSELINALFELCYENNEKAYNLNKLSYNDIEGQMRAIYHNGKADGAESILQKFNLMNDYRKYCDKRDNL